MKIGYQAYAKTIMGVFMKKTALVLASVAALSSSAFAKGSVNFAELKAKFGDGIVATEDMSPVVIMGTLIQGKGIKGEAPTAELLSKIHGKVAR